MAESPPESLRDGRYAVVGVLGEGAQGRTLQAVDKRGGRLVAIKRFRIRGAKQWKDVELAEREARVLSSLSHPALPTYVEHFEEDGALHLVMEKIEGEKLSSIRERGAPFSRADVIRFLKDAADALDYLHGRAPPVIHRDIKPGNVIRRPDGSFALVDFGAVRDSLKPEGGSTVVGTFGYMAPEQFQSRAMPASDVYAVGATALVMLTGVEPEDLPHQGLAIDVGAALAGQTDPALIRVLSSMLVPDPDQRASRIAPLLATLSSQPPNPAAAEHAAPGWQWQAQPAEPSTSTEDQFGTWQQFKHARRRARHARRGRRRARRHRAAREFSSHPLVVVVALLALALARIAAFALFRVFLPLFLTVLSIVFGKGMRRAAWACDRAGLRASEGLSRAARQVRERSDQAAALRHAERARARTYRIEPEAQSSQPGPRVRVGEAPPQDELLEEASHEQERPKVQRSGHD